MNIEIVYDNREKQPWLFDSFDCTSEVGFLKGGDYTMKGFEDLLRIERKKTTSEFAQNIFEERYQKWLDKLSSFKYAYIICEFSVDDINAYPERAGIPQKLMDKIKVKGNFILTNFLDIIVKKNIHVIFAGNRKNAEKIAFYILKKVIKNEESV